MIRNLSYLIPIIDVVKINEQSYFDTIKNNFLSLDHIYENNLMYENGVENKPNTNLKLNQINVMYRIYEDDGEFYGDYIYQCYNFYSDYFIAGIEKGKSVYLLNFKKEIKERINYKDVILADLFLYRKTEIKNLLIINLNKETKSDLMIFMEEKWNNILDEINILEEKHFPSPKLNLSLGKSESLLLFYSLFQKGVFSKDTTRADLGRFIDRNIT